MLSRYTSKMLLALLLFPTVVYAQDKVVIWSPGDNGTVSDWDTDPILAAVEEATDTDIQIERIGWDVYTDRINAAFASGQVPDIITTVDHNNKTLIGQMIADGIVAPFSGDLASAMPNVLAEYEANPSLSELKYDGQIYMVPVSWGVGNYPNAGLLHVRKDILDTLGMTPPETMNEFFAYVSACMDTGLQGVVFAGGGDGGLGNTINAFAGAYGLPFSGWVKTDSGFEAATIQPPMKDALLLFRNMVAEGLVDPQSWETQDGEETRTKFAAGENCALIFNGGGHVGRIQNDMDLATNGGQEWLLPAPALEAGSTRGYMSEPRFWSGTFITQLKGNNPEAAARVLDYLSSQEGLELTSLGIPDVDYSRDGDEIILNVEQRTADNFPAGASNTGSHPLATPIVSWVPQELQDFALLYGKDEAFKEWYAQMFANQGEYQIDSFGLLTTTPLWTEAQATLNELTARSFLELVRAVSDEEASALFDTYVVNWRSLGGEAAQAEMSEALEAIYQ